MKTCKVCTQEKPFDLNAKRQSKAAGFVGKVCWDCHVAAQKLKMQSLSGAKQPARWAHEASAFKAQRIKHRTDELYALEKQLARLLYTRTGMPADAPTLYAMLSIERLRVGSELTYLIESPKDTLACSEVLHLSPLEAVELLLRYRVEYSEAKSARFGPDACDELEETRE